MDKDLDKEKSEKEQLQKMYKGLYHDYDHDPDDIRLAPFDRLRNLLTEGDEVIVDENITGKIDFLLGDKEKPTPNKVEKWTWAKVKERLLKAKIWLDLKLFPNPHYNKYSKRRK